MRIVLVLLGLMMGLGIQGQVTGPTPMELRKVIQVLGPLHRRMGPVKPGDWLSLHPEKGQTFRQYLNCDPTLPRGKRRIIYLQPLGDFSSRQQAIVALTGEFLGHFFSLPVKVLPGLPLHIIPPTARRENPQTGDRQLLTSFIRQEVLVPRLPEDGAVLLGLTAWDLWPGEGWNFVFGEASLSERVGIWSLSRFGDPSRNPESFRRCLLRTLGTAAHETGHMISMLHCTRYECAMNGSESLEEADRQPLELCPECLAKVCWATRTQPRDRLRRLLEFCRRNGLDREVATYDGSLQALSSRRGGRRPGSTLD